MVHFKCKTQSNRIEYAIIRVEFVLVFHCSRSRRIEIHYMHVLFFSIYSCTDFTVQFGWYRSIIMLMCHTNSLGNCYDKQKSKHVWQHTRHACSCSIFTKRSVYECYCFVCSANIFNTAFVRYTPYTCLQSNDSCCNYHSKEVRTNVCLTVTTRIYIYTLVTVHSLDRFDVLFVFSSDAKTERAKKGEQNKWKQHPNWRESMGNLNGTTSFACKFRVLGQFQTAACSRRDQLI